MDDGTDSLPSMPDSPIPNVGETDGDGVKANRQMESPPGSPSASAISFYQSVIREGGPVTNLQPVDGGQSRRANVPKPTTATHMAEPASSEYKNATLRFCTVCASNNNRSMEAHRRLSVYFPTISFGTGSLVRLPGPSMMEPNVYKFNITSYADIYNELESKDAWLYKANGLLPMLARNKSIKWGPERWQDWQVGAPRLAARFAADSGASGTEAGVVDVVITCEARCWDAVIEDLHSRGAPLNRPVHVINIDIKDNHDEAVVGASAILDLAKRLDGAAKQELESAGESKDGWQSGSASGARAGFDDRVPVILAQWQDRYPNLPAMWSLSWF